MDVTPLKTKSQDELRRAIEGLLHHFTNPAFGAIPKREIELAVFQMMRDLDVIPHDASLYDLMTRLKITRAKASQLLFDIEMRRIGDDTAELDRLVKEALCQTRFAKDQTWFVLEIENVLVIAHLKEMIRRLNHVSDTSFNTELVKLKLDAMNDLIAALLSQDEQTAVKAALIKAGAPDTTFKGMLKSALTHLARKAAGHAAGAALDQALTPILSATTDQITQIWSEILDPPASD